MWPRWSCLGQGCKTVCNFVCWTSGGFSQPLVSILRWCCASAVLWYYKYFCRVVVIFFVAALQHLAILMGVIISIISVQFAHRIGHLSHCCSVLAEIWPVCPYNMMWCCGTFFPGVKCGLGGLAWVRAVKRCAILHAGSVFAFLNHWWAF